MQYYTYFFVLLRFSVMSVEVNTTNCTVLKNALAEAVGKFTECAIQNSRPITMCENCVKFYIDVLNSYSNMTSNYAEDETSCIDNFTNLDRLQIVDTLYSNSYDLWNRGKCYDEFKYTVISGKGPNKSVHYKQECFQLENNTLTPNRSKETIQFNKYYDGLMTCVNRSDLNETAMCSTCMQAYVNLSDFYISISNENEKIGVCMDIVDLMNSTRAFWSEKCCIFRKHDESIFLSSTVVVFVITALFYLISQFYVTRKSPVILTQRRLAESLNHCSEEATQSYYEVD